MKQFILIFSVLCSNFSKGGCHQSDDDKLPAKAILSNIIRAQSNPSYQKTHQQEMLSENILTQFLNRFQPALDRESKRVAEKIPIVDEIKVEDYNYKPRGYRSAFTNNDKYVQCTRLPSKVMCKSGLRTFIINTQERNINNDDLQMLIEQINQKLQEKEDKSHDLSLPASLKRNYVSLTNESNASPDEGLMRYNPLTVECSPAESHKRSNNEIIKYNCVWHQKKSSPDTTNFKILSAAVAKTCFTPLSVRKFSEVCTAHTGWCPDKTITCCKTSAKPICIPWCNPF